MDWKKHRGTETHIEGNMVPNFHIETTMRKWGGLHTEVLSVQCTTDDAKYLKYLLVEAGEKRKFHIGYFVPTGIHLMEGKEVLYRLLKEQQDFLMNMASFQIGGITCDEMYYSDTDSGSVKDFLMKAGGVSAVEQMYHTSYSGQWTIVVHKDQVSSLVQYISTNIQVIYGTNNPDGPQRTTISAYVGNLNTKGSTKVSTTKSTADEPTDVSGREANNSEATQMKTSGNRFGCDDQQIFKNNTNKEKDIHMKDTAKPTYENIVRMKLQELDNKLNLKIQTIEQTLETTNQKMEERIEEIMNKKVRSISRIVSDAVTNKIMSAMTTMLAGQSKGTTTPCTIDKQIITQDSPGKVADPVRALYNTSPAKPTNKYETQNSLQDMVTELTNIEKQTLTLNDSTHDVHKTTESSTEVS